MRIYAFNARYPRRPGLVCGINKQSGAFAQLFCGAPFCSARQL